MSDGKRQILADMLVGVARQTFVNQEHSLYWITLLSIESAFDQSAKSPVGALGIAQIMPAYVADFSRLCGFERLTERDLLDTYTNAILGACIFRSLIEQTGSVPLAAVAYNAGPNSASFKAAKKGDAPVATETQGYVAKLWLRLLNTKKELSSD